MGTKYMSATDRMMTKLIKDNPGVYKAVKIKKPAKKKGTKRRK